LNSLKFFLAGCFLFFEISSAFAFDEALFQKKKSILIREVADVYTPPSMNIGDPQKYYWPKSMARFERYGLQDSLANAWVRQLADLPPFHFTLVGMARILFLYNEAPAVAFSRTKIIENVLNRTDRYNAWTSEGTENHISMSRTSGYLYAQEAVKLGIQTPKSQQHMAEMKTWLLNWAAKLYQKGNGEWNSGIYGVYNMIGWLNLYDFAEDKEVKLAAKAVVDYYALEFAFYYSWGVVGGAEMRGSDIGGSYGGSVAYNCWLWYSENESPDFSAGREYIQAMHAATSSYRPPSAFVALGQKHPHFRGFYHVSRPDYLLGRQSFVKQFFMVGNGYTLGSAVSAYGGWSGATSQIVNWKLVAQNTINKPIELSGNGRYYTNRKGKIRDPYTQVAQHKNVIILLSKLPENHATINKEIEQIINKWKTAWAKDFLIRYPDKKEFKNVVNKITPLAAQPGVYLATDQKVDWHIEGKQAFAQLGSVFVGLQAVSGNAISFEQQQGKGKNAKASPYEPDILVDEGKMGQLTGFILYIGGMQEYSNLEAFKKAFTTIGNTLNKIGDKVQFMTPEGENIAVQYEENGTFEEAMVDWGYGTTERHITITAPPFIQPQWPSGKGHGKIPSFTVNGQEVLNTSPWPLYSGTYVQMDKGVLEVISADKQTYRVDFTGPLPVWE
jgi:hypothetical protein